MWSLECESLRLSLQDTHALVGIQRLKPGLQGALIWGITKPGASELFLTSPLHLRISFLLYFFFLLPIQTDTQ